MTHIKTAALTFALTFTILFTAAALPAAALPPEGPGGRILSLTDDPASAITVTWEDRADAETSELRCSAYPDMRGARRIPGEPVPNDSPIPAEGRRFTARIQGLLPGVQYWYDVGGETRRSAPAGFRTAESGVENFHFLFFGDTQIVKSAAEDYAAWGDLARAAVARHPGVAFALHAGDIVESGISREQWNAFLAEAESVFSKIPFLPTNGNHESNFLSGKPELYKEIFTLPQNGPEGFKEEFYSFDYGNVHIAVLNSWVFSGEQKLDEAAAARLNAWIADDLGGSKSAWKIVLTHIPVYAVHSDTTAAKVRENWAPLFERYGVDLVLVGHQHVYSRLRPLTGGVTDYEDGVTYVMGNSGLKYYGAADESLAERTVYDTSTYQLITVDGDSLSLQTFDRDGNESDFTILSPRGAGAFSFDDVFI
jgi:hypothetical protein